MSVTGNRIKVSHMMLRYTLPLLLSTGCQPSQCDIVASLPDDGTLLTLGDSILAWSSPRCESVSDYIGVALSTRAHVAAVNGAWMLDGDPAIPLQHIPGPWSTVIINGGANDLNDQCGCGECDDILDQLSTPDGAYGAMPFLVDDITASGAAVALLGYYQMPDSAWYGFDACGAAITALNERYETIARQRELVTFVPLEDVMRFDERPEDFAFDNVHPSAEGAERIASAVAAAIAP